MKIQRRISALQANDSVRMENLILQRHNRVLQKQAGAIDFRVRFESCRLQRAHLNARRVERDERDRPLQSAGYLRRKARGSGKTLKQRVSTLSSQEGRPIGHRAVEPIHASLKLALHAVEG